MSSRQEKGGGSFAGIKLLPCENPLPPLEEAIAAAQAELPRANYYTEPHSAPLRRLIAAQLGVPERHGILVKAALGDARLGPGYMRVTTALPEDNARFIAALGELL